MKRLFLVALLGLMTIVAQAQRVTDKLDRGLVAMKAGVGVYLSWRIFGEEYYDVTYNVYRDGVKVNDAPLSVSNYTDNSGTTASTYTVAAVVKGKEQEPCQAVTPWASSYKEIKLKHEGIKSTLVPNDACCADVDGDGELEILMKFDNLSEMSASFLQARNQSLTIFIIVFLMEHLPMVLPMILQVFVSSIIIRYNSCRLRLRSFLTIH